MSALYKLHKLCITEYRIVNQQVRNGIFICLQEKGFHTLKKKPCSSVAVTFSDVARLFKDCRTSAVMASLRFGINFLLSFSSLSTLRCSQLSKLGRFFPDLKSLPDMKHYSKKVHLLMENLSILVGAATSLHSDHMADPMTTSVTESCCIQSDLPEEVMLDSSPSSQKFISGSIKPSTKFFHTSSLKILINRDIFKIIVTWKLLLVTWGQFNKTFASVIYKCSHCFRC